MHWQKTHTMKKTVTCALFLLIHLLGFSKPVEFYLDICRFQKNFNKASFISVNLAVAGNSLTWQEIGEDQYQAQVEIDLRLYLLLGQDTLPSYLDKFKLSSLIVTDTSSQERSAWIPYVDNIDFAPGRSSGRYLLQVLANDPNQEGSPSSMALSEFEMRPPAVASFAFSDIEYISRWTHNKNQSKNMFSRPEQSFDFDIIPYPSNGVYINQDTLHFYTELYNTNKVTTKYFLVRTHIKQGEKILPSYTKIDSRNRRANYRNYHVDYYDISALETQSYHLVIELLDGESMQVVESTSKHFVIVNPRVEPEFDRYVANQDLAGIFRQYSEPELDYYLRTLIHISTEQEISFAKALQTQKIDSYDMKKNFLYSFWSKRVRRNQTVAALWRGHLAALNYVNQHYGAGNREGWESDRGRVFLKYGIPSDVERYPSETGIVPYEIWRYDRLETQSNVEFIFVNTIVATDDYTLIHSAKYGEVKNPNWRNFLLNRERLPVSIDFEDGEDSPLNRYDTKIRIKD